MYHSIQFKKHLIFAIILLHFCFQSCQNKKENKSNQLDLSTPKVSVKLIDKLILQLNDYTSDWSNNIQYYSEGDKKQIITLNNSTNSIQFYNMEGELDHEIICQKEGPHTTGAVQSFLYKGPDSLFILNANTHRVYRLSDKGEVITFYQLEVWDTTKYFTIPFGRCGMEMYLNNNHLYIVGRPGLYYWKKPYEYLHNGKLCIDLNLINGNHIDQISFPNIDLFNGKNYSIDVINANRTINSKNSEFIYSFPADNTVYTYTFDGKLKNKYLLQSKYAEEELKPMASWSIVDDSYKEYFHFLKNVYYTGMYYDPYRNLYYRLVKLGTNTEYTIADVDNKKSIDCRYSLIIADGNLNKIDEVDLDIGARHQLVAVIDRGLLILNKHEPKEDEMKFHLYKVDVLPSTQN